MTKNILQYFCIISFFLFANNSYSQSQKIIIKLKKNTPPAVVNNFINNNAKSGNTSIAMLCRNYDITGSKQLFGKALNKISRDEDEKFNFSKIFVADLGVQDKEQVFKLLLKNEYVEYVQENNKYELNGFIPNDPYYS